MSLIKDYGFITIMFGFPLFLRYLLSIALQQEVSWAWYLNKGEILTSLKVILGYLMIQMLLLVAAGPWKHDHHHVPNYKLNGIQSFVLSSILTVCLWSRLSWVYLHFADLIMTLEWLAWLLCFILYLKGLYYPTQGSPRHQTGNLFKDFVVGIEQYPAINDYQLKQVFNCRFGMMGWSTIVICCLAYQQQTYGTITNSLLTSSMIQLIYIAKFFWWENGYFSTIDVNYDYFGFYIAWGVTYCVPGFYTYSSIYLANRSMVLSSFQCVLYLTLGVVAIYINYEADHQKVQVRKNKSTNIQVGKNKENEIKVEKIWGQAVKTLTVKYHHDGIEKTTVLCLSGWWGVSRHFHYIPEVVTCLAWALPCGFDPWQPYVYFIYLSILLMHRIHRDEEKCSRKYGDYYKEYKRLVPYRLIPYVY